MKTLSIPPEKMLTLFNEISLNLLHCFLRERSLSTADTYISTSSTMQTREPLRYVSLSLLSRFDTVKSTAHSLEMSFHACMYKWD